MKAAHKVSQKWTSDKATYTMLLLDLNNVPITEKNFSSSFLSLRSWLLSCVFLIYKNFGEQGRYSPGPDIIAKI
jgi:hypothetical protein